MVPRLERMWRMETRGRTKRDQFGWCFQKLSWWTIGLFGSSSRQLFQFSIFQRETLSLGSSVTSIPALLCLHTEQSFHPGNRSGFQWEGRTDCVHWAQGMARWVHWPVDTRLVPSAPWYLYFTMLFPAQTTFGLSPKYPCKSCLIPKCFFS